MKKGNKGWIGKRAVWAGLLALLAPLWASGQGLAPVDWDGLVLDGEKPTAVADELIVIYKEGAVRPAAGPKAPGTPPPFFGKLAWQQPMSAPASHAAAGAVEVLPFGRIHGEQVRLAAGGGVAAMRAAAAKYEANPDVLCAEPNYMFYTRKAPDDTFYNIITNGLLQLWGMKAIGAEEAWNITTGSLDIVVAVIDTGIGNELGGYPIDPRNSHPDLAANMWRNTAETGLYYTDFHDLADRETDGIDNSGNGHIDDWRGWNAVSWNNWPRDGNDHGTHCAGTIGGVGDNQTGVAGVCWRVSLVGVKGLNDDGGGDSAMLSRAVEYVSWFDGREGRPRIHLSNNSWGGGGPSTATYMAVQLCREAGQLFVAAAGNNGTDNDATPSYPSCYPVDNIISVANLRVMTNNIVTGEATHYRIADSSQYGATTVHVGAPGTDIISTIPIDPRAYDPSGRRDNTLGYDYASFTGTSMAAPHVAGAAALLLSWVPEADYRMLWDALVYSASNNTANVSIIAGNPPAEHHTLTDGMIYIPYAMQWLAKLQVSPHFETMNAFGPAGGAMFTGLPAEISLRNPMTGDRVDSALRMGNNCEITVAAEIIYTNSPAGWLDLWWRGANEGQAFTNILLAGEAEVLEVRQNAVADGLPEGTYTALVVVEDYLAYEQNAIYTNTVYTNTIVLRVSGNYAVQSAVYDENTWLEPGKGAGIAQYTVLADDTLEIIAAKYGVGVTLIKSLNGWTQWTDYWVNLQILPLMVGSEINVPFYSLRWTRLGDHLGYYYSRPEISQKIMLPFDFSYYGETYQEMWLAADGIMGFGPWFPRFGSCDLPTLRSPAPLIMPYWDILTLRRPTEDSFIATEFLENPRRFVVTWRNMVSYGVTDREPPVLDFQVVLYDRSSTSSAPGAGYDIRFNYKTASQDYLRCGGRYATVGLQGGEGLGAKTYSVKGYAPERQFLPRRVAVDPEWPMQVTDSQSLLFTWGGMLPDAKRPEVVEMKIMSFMPGNMGLAGGFNDGVAIFEMRFNEVVFGLEPGDFELSADTMPGAYVSWIAGGGERFYVTVQGLGRFGRVRIRLKDAVPQNGIGVQDLYGNWNLGMPEFVTAVAPFVREGFTDDFESGTGFWTWSNNEYNMLETKGWEYGAPVGPTAYNDGPFAAHGGSGNCWGTLLAQNCPPGMDACLDSPEVWLGDAPILDFYYWLSVEKAIGDEAFLEISDGGGFEIIYDLASVPASVPGGPWNRLSLPLDDKFKNKLVKFRFHVKTLLNQAYVGDPSGNRPGQSAGLYIDNFQVLNLQNPGLWLVDAGPQPLAAGAAVQLETLVYNSTDGVIPFAGGIYGSADSALQVLTKGMQFYGAMEPGGLFTNHYVTVQTAASAGDYRRNVIPLAHEGFDSVDFLNASDTPLRVNITPAAQNKVIRAYNVPDVPKGLLGAHVVDWAGLRLRGDGSARSAIFQLVQCAGSTPAAPLPDGSPTGGDRVLYTHVEWNTHGRFGASNVPADEGQFDRKFAHNLASGARVFVRAWDGASFDSSVAYGDSAVEPVSGASLQEIHFGGWTVGKPTQPLRDSNRDGIPDGWALANGLDPRASNGPVDPHFEIKQSAATGGVGAVGPRRAIAVGNYVYAVLYNENISQWGEIQVWTKNLQTRVAVYSQISASGIHNFNPTSLCLSKDKTKLYVTTSKTDVVGNVNSRVLSFAITGGGATLGGVPSGSALPALKVYPAVNAQFGPANPIPFQNLWEVALDEADGHVYVVDNKAWLTPGHAESDYYCVRKINMEAATPVEILSAGWEIERWLLESKEPRSLALDADYFYIGTSDNGGASVWRVGFNTGLIEKLYGNLAAGHGIALGVGGSGFFYVAEANRNQLSLFNGQAGTPPAAAYKQPDNFLSTPLNGPQGVFVDLDNPYHSVLVSDTGNKRLLWLRLYADLDGDGIDDAWQCYYFGETWACDPWADPDGDGMPNIGEYRAGTNPLVADSNNNGAEDQWGLYNPGVLPNNVPYVTSVTASTNVITAGESVTLTVTFNRDVSGYLAGHNPDLQLVFGNGAFTGDLALSGNVGGNTYTFVFTAHTSSPTGAVDVVVSNAKGVAAPTVTTDPVRFLATTVFYIEGSEEEEEEEDSPGFVPHEGALEIISFTAHPLHIKWTAQPKVKYWIITSTSLAIPYTEWPSAFPDGFSTLSEPPLVIDANGHAEKSDEGDTTFEPAPTRFFRVTTEEPQE